MLKLEKLMNKFERGERISFIIDLLFRESNHQAIVNTIHTLTSSPQTFLHPLQKLTF